MSRYDISEHAHRGPIFHYDDARLAAGEGPIPRKQSDWGEQLPSNNSRWRKRVRRAFTVISVSFYITEHCACTMLRILWGLIYRDSWSTNAVPLRQPVRDLSTRARALSTGSELQRTQEALVQSKLIIASIGNENVELHKEMRRMKATLERMVDEKAEWLAERATLQERGAQQSREIASLKERLGEGGSAIAGSSPEPSTPPMPPLRSGGRRPSLGTSCCPYDSSTRTRTLTSTHWFHRPDARAPSRVGRRR